MKNDIHKNITISEIISIIGYVFGLVIFVLLGNRHHIFSAIIDNLKEWNLYEIIDLIKPYVYPFLGIFFGLICTMVPLVLVSHLINNKLLKKKAATQDFATALFVSIIGFITIPMIIFLIGVVILFAYLVWWLAEFINIFLFGYISYFFFCVIEFIFVKILFQEINLTKFNQESKYMFFQTIIFFSILPYAFRWVAIGFEKLLSKISGEIATFVLKPVRLLSISFFRYITYVFAFYTYIMGFLWNVSGNINDIKEGLLAFIIIDVVIFGLYSFVAENRKKEIILNCISISRDLELIKNEIIRYNLFSYINCSALIKKTFIIEEFNKKVKKSSDDNLMIIYEKINRITNKNSNHQKNRGLQFKDLYIEIDRIQELLDKYIVS